MAHQSVLLQEIIASLCLHTGGTYLDGTFGAGGHSRHIARKIGREGRLIALDQDKTVFGEDIVSELSTLTQFTPVVENFRNVKQVLEKLHVHEIDGAILDLGLSSTQLDASGRGFSFQRDEPLQMTFMHDPDTITVTASDIANDWSEESIVTILQGFGEERFARRIARGIVEARKTKSIDSTGQLVEIIRQHTPGWYHHGRTHFATRTFQAFRMAVNDELGAIESGLDAICVSLAQEGRMAVISFHSIEDRLVKQLFRRYSEKELVKMVTKRPVSPSEDELKDNPRSRSAKLRVIEKL